MPLWAAVATLPPPPLLFRPRWHPGDMLTAPTERIEYSTGRPEGPNRGFGPDPAVTAAVDKVVLPQYNGPCPQTGGNILMEAG